MKYNKMHIDNFILTTLHIETAIAYRAKFTLFIMYTCRIKDKDKNCTYCDLRIN